VNDELLAVIREHTTPAEYEALILDADGHTYADAAGFLGITIHAYHKRLVRARKRIKDNVPRPNPKSTK